MDTIQLPGKISETSENARVNFWHLKLGGKKIWHVGKSQEKFFEAQNGRKNSPYGKKVCREFWPPWNYQEKSQAHEKMRREIHATSEKIPQRGENLGHYQL